MKKVVSLLALWIVAADLSGCSTTSGAVANPLGSQTVYHSVYIVDHGGSGADMDANIQREFLRHGFAVKAGMDDGDHTDAQMLVRYVDNWKWDLKMYLRSLDVMIYDSKSGNLIATGQWENSVIHGFYSSEKVVTQVVDETLAKGNVHAY